jgi:hypothetical protein
MKKSDDLERSAFRVAIHIDGRPASYPAWLSHDGRFSCGHTYQDVGGEIHRAPLCFAAQVSRLVPFGAMSM